MKKCQLLQGFRKEHWINTAGVPKVNYKMWIEPNSFFYFLKKHWKFKGTTKQLHMILSVIFSQFVRNEIGHYTFLLYRRNQLHFDISFKFWLYFFSVPCDLWYMWDSRVKHNPNHMNINACTNVVHFLQYIVYQKQIFYTEKSYKI